MSTLYLFFFFVSFVKGQTPSRFPEYSLARYTDESGLPQNSVKGIARDGSGFIWMITESGMVRFDGSELRTYNEPSHYVSTNRFHSIQPAVNSDDPGKFYLVSANNDYFQVKNGRIKLDSSYGKMIDRVLSFSSISPGETALSIGAPNVLWENDDNWCSEYMILVSARPGTFYRCTRSTVEFVENWKRKASFSGRKINFKSLLRIGDKLLHINDDGHILLFDKEKAPRVMKLSGDIVDETIVHFDRKKLRIYWNNVADQAYLYLNKMLFSIKLNTAGAVVTHAVLKDFDFEAREVSTIFADKTSGKIFIGSKTDGLFVFNKQDFNAHLVKSDKQIDNVFYTQLRWDDSTIVVPKGYRIGLGTSGSFIEHTLPAIRKKDLPSSAFMLRDSSGALWTRKNTRLIKFGKLGSSIVDEWQFQDDPSAMFEDGLGGFYVGLYNGQIYHMTASTGRYQPRLLCTVGKIPISMQREGNTLWFGTHLGLFKVDRISGSVKIIQGTEQMSVRSIFCDNNSRIWFTSYEQGLFLYQKGILTKFPRDEDGFLNASHCIVTSEKNYFWIPTNHGLFRFKIDELVQWASEKDPSWKPYYLYYNKSNGLKVNEFNGGCQPCSVTLPNGTVSLPSMRGLVWFSPNAVSKEFVSNGFIFDRVVMNGKSHEIHGELIHIDRESKQTEVHISVPYLGNQKNVQIEYGLSSLTDDRLSNWIPLSAVNSVIFFSELNAGEYKLTVRLRSGFGKGNYKQKTIILAVKPYWYETTWFKILCAALLIIVLFFFYRNRTARIYRRNRELEEQINERTSVLKYMLDEVQFSERALKRQMNVRTHLLASISHDIYNPMRYLLLCARHMHSQIGIKNDEAREASRFIVTSSERMMTLLENTVEYIKSQRRPDQLKREFVNLKSLLDQKIAMFEVAINRQYIRVTLDISPDAFVLSDPVLLAVIVNNLIDNAARHSGGNKIDISFSENDNTLTFRDSGVGYPSDILDWLSNDPSETEDKSTKASGLGLVLIKELCTLLGIHLQVYNASGAVVSLRLPDPHKE